MATTRRGFLRDGAGVAGASLLAGWWLEAADAVAAEATAGWDAGDVAHVLPTAGPDRLLLKASLRRPPRDPPRLRVGDDVVPGRRTDAAGRFWRFEARGLRPGRPYRLRLLGRGGRDLAEPWRLRTLPAPGARPERVRLLIFTCAGGHDVFLREAPLFQPARVRRRLLRRGLSFAPDAVIANGDHVYWDLEAGLTAAFLGDSEAARRHAGTFDPALPARGGHNERVLLKAAGPQIVDVYGTDCRSVPVFFLTDDHDYFENDDATDRIVTFPPPWWKLQLARATQRLYYPELLPVPGQPSGLPWSSGRPRARRVSECFGALRYGRLLELLMYDSRRTLTLAGQSAVVVDPAVEAWLTSRMRAPEVAHVVNMPSTPPGWSAGKWAEWYPDVLGPDGRLTTERPKPHWQPGWLAQHDRLLTAMSAMRGRVPLVIGGDLHATAAATITRAGTRDLTANPVHVALSGTLGSDELGFPSAIRGTRPAPPRHLDVAEAIDPIEENGFLLADFERDRVVLRFFRWSKRRPEAEIDRLRPFRTIELGRP